MVEMVARIPLVRNLTDPGHMTESSPMPADGQSVSVGAVTSVADGAIWTKRRPEPHTHPVNGPTGEVGSDAGALPMAAVISSSLRSSQMSMSAVLVPPLSVLLPFSSPSLPLLPPQDARTSKAAHAIAILGLMKRPFAKMCPSTPRLGRLSSATRGIFGINAVVREALQASFIETQVANLAVTLHDSDSRILFYAEPLP
jgi:hypothetical protein